MILLSDYPKHVSAYTTDTHTPTHTHTHRGCSSHIVVVVQSLSYVRLFATPWIAACQASLSFTISWSLLKLMSIELVMPSNHLVLCCPLLLLPSILPSVRVFSNELALCIRWPKYWSFSFRISPSNEYSGLVSFKIDWSDLLGVQGTLKSLLQHCSSKALVLSFFCLHLNFMPPSFCIHSFLWLNYMSSIFFSAY